MRDQLPIKPFTNEYEQEACLDLIKYHMKIFRARLEEQGSSYLHYEFTRSELVAEIDYLFPSIPSE